MTTTSPSNVTVLYQCPSAYKCSDIGLVLPLMNESDWSVVLRSILYFLGMIYCFVGIAIVSDIFMSAIETITSTTRTIKVATIGPAKSTGGPKSIKDSKPDSPVAGVDRDREPEQEELQFKEVEIKVWNDTVANLTLMALGSSAPEILLAIIETIGNGFEAGELGPATIVGSAAFNLHVITGVCISSIPNGEKKTIKEGGVFVCTAVISLLAYFWLYVILGPISKNVVDVWEAVLTLCFFPILVILAYLVDKNFFCLGGKKKSKIGVMDDEDDSPIAAADGLYLSMPANHHLGKRMSVDKAKVAQVMKSVEDKNISPEDAAALVAQKIHEERPHSRAYHRASRRSMRSTHSLASKMSSASIGRDIGGDQHGSDDVRVKPDNTSSRKCVVEFTANTVSVYEGEKKARIGVKRVGNVSARVSVKYETCNGTAEAGTDFVAQKDFLIFEPQEKLKYIEIDLIDDSLEEDDETFFVKLSLDKQLSKGSNNNNNNSKERNESGSAVMEHATSSPPKVQIGSNAICTVVLMNDDEPGQFEFERPSFLVKESVGTARIPVKRQGGTDGACSVQWRAIFVSSGPGGGGDNNWGGPEEGKLNFQHGEASGCIELNIVDTSKERAMSEAAAGEGDLSRGTSLMSEQGAGDKSVQLVLTEATNGAKIGKRKSAVVTLVPDDEYAGVLDRITNLANIDLQKLNFAFRSWGEQIHEAMNVNGGEFNDAHWTDYIFHAFTFLWKVTFALLVPPPKYLGGWLTFVVSLTMIGLLTAVVGDLAAIFGCLLGLKDLVTAITFVALGTSLPDLFASKQAAATDKHADNAVGNVTGSNSVNVFLGLGLPWTMASIYWASKGEKFIVISGSFSYSVVLYSGTAVVSLFILGLRRFLPVFGNAELGGPTLPKYISSSVMLILWFLYIIFSALESYNYIDGF
ncbi:sodium/calcium exchanger 2-like isoform X2 [Symsagittifera roscoffensis]|uniref:sodium/calcium exchanger 2-like isoform X2 n=1 Tax=Symsagittifera roscoffensis TaxID=84072 RepID=UPI00307B735D